MTDFHFLLLTVVVIVALIVFRPKRPPIERYGPWPGIGWVPDRENGGWKRTEVPPMPPPRKP